MVFENPFFSLKGQAERLSNAFQTVKAAVTLQGVKANTGNKTADVILGSVASNPYVAALPFAKVGGVTIASSVATKAVSGFQSLSLTKQAAVVGGGLVAGSALVSSPKATAAVINTPKALVNVGGNIGKVIENPSIEGVKKIFKENPVISTGAVVAGVGALGLGAGALANTLATSANTSALKEQTAQAASSLVAAPIPATETGKAQLTPELTKAAQAPNSSPLLSEKTSEVAAPPNVPQETKGGSYNRVSNKVNILMSNRMGNKSTKNTKIYKLQRVKRR